MKYLKYFESDFFLDEEDKSFETLKEDIMDICLELTDIGFVVKVSRGSYPCISIRSKGIDDETDSNYFDYIDVKETVERLKRYLGYKLKYIQVGNDVEDEDNINIETVWHDLNKELDGIMPNCWYLYNIYQLNIEFTI